ncbi:MAG: type VI immunity family protein [Myxococcota bacterium]|nr:type VI immunity family protein [Myxococcota bacterium]
MDEAPSLTPKRAVLDADRELSIVRVAKGLTVYFSDGLHWSAEGAPALFDAFLRRVDPAALGWFTTSMMHRWEARVDTEIDALRNHLVADRVLGRVRHLFTFEVADDRLAPVVAFRYHEVDPARARHAGWAQLIFPREFPADELLALALEIGQLHPIRCATAGWIASVAPGLGGTADDALYGMCKRYLGLDVPRPAKAAKAALRWLPSPAWLSLLGPDLLPRERAGSLAELTFDHEDVKVFQLSRGTLIRAGASPELADVNQMELPLALAEVAQRLDRYLDPEPARFGGRWGEDDARGWVHRFAAPEHWR